MNNASTPQALSWGQSFRNDFLPSVVVFLIALPLCLGIAIASGAPPVAGLITGIVGGLVVGWIAGSPLQVSGPAAGLTVIVYDLFQRYEIQLVMLAILIAGLMQIVAGMLKLGQWFRAVSPAVIQGMLAGIGVLIFSSQFHIMADDKPREGMELFGIHLHAGLANFLTIPETIWKVFTPGVNPTHQWAAGLGISTIAIIVLWKFVARGKLKMIPGPLLGVTLATLATFLFGLNVEQLTWRIPDNLAGGLQLPDLGLWMAAPWQSILFSAMVIALVASAETLLCATAVDQMHNGERTKYDRELMAQGVGNSVCGLLGGLPMTGVIVRSSANVDAGAKTRMSAVMHGAWLLAFVAVAPMLLKIIPISSLAAVLVYTGYKLVNPQAVKKLWKYGKSEVGIYLATMITIVSTDLLMGVLTGIVLAALKLLFTFSHLDTQIEQEDHRTIMRLNGTATFIRLPKLAAALEKVPAGSELHVDFSQLDYIDHACLELLINWEKQHAATGGSLTIDWEGLAARFRSVNGKKPTWSTESNGSHAGETEEQNKEEKRQELAASSKN